MELNIWQTICSCWIQTCIFFFYKSLQIFKAKDFLFNARFNCDLCLTAFDFFSECQRGIKCFGYLRVTYCYLLLYSNSRLNLSFIFLMTNVQRKCPTYPSSLMELLLTAQLSEQWSAIKSKTKFSHYFFSFFPICSDFFVWSGWYLRKALKIPELV